MSKEELMDWLVKQGFQRNTEEGREYQQFSRGKCLKNGAGMIWVEIEGDKVNLAYYDRDIEFISNRAKRLSYYGCISLVKIGKRGKLAGLKRGYEE